MTICFLLTIPFETSRLYARQCCGIANEGAHVILIAPWALPSNSSGVEVRRVSSWPGALGKLLSAPVVLWSALQVRADIYHIHSIQLVLCGVLLKVIFRKRVVYDMFEDFGSMVLTSRSLPECFKRLSRLVIYLLERLACSTVDGIVTADPAVMRIYSSKNKVIGKAKRRVFYNFPAEWFVKSCRLESRRRTKKYDVVFSGGLSQRTGLVVLLEAIELIAQAGVRPRVLMFGYADESTFVQKYMAEATRRGVGDCFEVLGRVSPFEVPLLVSQARVGVVPLQRVPKFLNNIPTKMFEYWACGVPVVASDLPPIRLFFREGELGHLVDPMDARGFARCIGGLLVNARKAEALGARAREAVQRRMHGEYELRKLARLYLTVVGRGEDARCAERANVARLVEIE